MVRDDLDHDVYIMMYKGFEDIKASTEDRNEFWNKYKNLKEACRLMWVQKGHLPDENTIMASAPGYFKRQWGNHENVVHEEGFNEAFLEWLKENYLQSR